MDPNYLKNNKRYRPETLGDVWGILQDLKTFQADIDEYSMMSHCQGSAKLEYNGGFRPQLQVLTFIGSVT